MEGTTKESDRENQERAVTAALTRLSGAPGFSDDARLVANYLDELREELEELADADPFRHMVQKFYRTIERLDIQIIGPAIAVRHAQEAARMAAEATRLRELEVRQIEAETHKERIRAKAQWFGVAVGSGGAVGALISGLLKLATILLGGSP